MNDVVELRDRERRIADQRIVGPSRPGSSISLAHFLWSSPIDAEPDDCVLRLSNSGFRRAM